MYTLIFGDGYQMTMTYDDVYAFSHDFANLGRNK